MTDIADQERVVQSLKNLFENATLVDRRQQPSHGYRAVHVIAKCRGKLIEIQVRTSLQHLWAELSEKYSDIRDPAIKYGGGDEEIQKILTSTSLTFAQEEALETILLDKQISLSSQNKLTDEKKKEITTAQENLSSIRREMFKDFSDIINRLEEIEGGEDALSD